MAPMIRTPAEADAAYSAAQLVVRTHERLVNFLKAGQTLAQIDQFVAATLDDFGSRSCFLHYRAGRTPPFPSHACLSLNDCVVHGTAGFVTRPIQQGDLLKIDIGVAKNGWLGDAAWTYSIGKPEPKIRKLMDCGKESLRRGVAQLHPKNTYSAWARTVQDYVEHECHFHLIRGLGGHGYGRAGNKKPYRDELHAPPYVSNVMPEYGTSWTEANMRCEPGTLVAVEPMIAIGTGEIRGVNHDKWPILTADGSMSVHYEHDVLITENGPRVLTEGLDALPDVIE